MESSFPTWIIPAILGIVFAGIAVLLFIVALISRKKAQASQAWPTAPGAIVSSSIQEHQQYDADDQSTSTSYEPVIQYRYTIMGQEYLGSRVAFGASSFGRSQAEAIVNRYRPNQAVSVHYDPQEPSESVLETKAAGANIFLIVAVVFLVIGIISCCASVYVGLTS